MVDDVTMTQRDNLRFRLERAVLHHRLFHSDRAFGRALLRRLPALYEVRAVLY